MPTEHQRGQSLSLRKCTDQQGLGQLWGVVWCCFTTPNPAQAAGLSLTEEGIGLFWQFMCSMRRGKKKYLNCMQLLLLREVATHPWEISSLISSTGRKMKVEVPISSQRQMWHFRGRGIQGNNKIWDREQGEIIEEWKGRKKKRGCS